MLQPWNSSEGTICPDCNQKTIEFQLVGDKKTKIGWGLVWCSACHNGIHISRMKIPQNCEVISYEESIKREDLEPKDKINWLNP